MLTFIAAAVGPAMVAGFALSPNAMRTGARPSSSLRMMAAAEGKQRVLVIGGTRFSGLYLTKELHSRGHEVCAPRACAGARARGGVGLGGVGARKICRTRQEKGHT